MSYNVNVKIYPDSVTSVQAQLAHGDLHLLSQETKKRNEEVEDIITLNDNTSKGKVMIYIMNSINEPADIGTKVQLVYPNGTREIKNLSKPGILLIEEISVGKVTIEKVIPVDHSI